MSTSIRQCVAACKNDWQDKRYGGKRVMNKTNNNWRCTVCGKESVVEVKKR